MGRTMKFITYLPTRHNDGTPVAPSELQASIARLAFTFGGCSILTAEGRWYDPADGQLYCDESLRVEVAYAANQRGAIEPMIVEFGRLLKQEAMYLELVD